MMRVSEGICELVNHNIWLKIGDIGSQFVSEPERLSMN